MLYLKKKKLLFIHNQKCAGQYVSKILDEHMTMKDYHIGGTPIGEYHQESYMRRYNLNKHSSISEVVASDLNLDLNFFSFAIVRDPVDRVISAYRYLKGVPDRPWNKGFIHKIRRMSFFDFIETKYLGWLASQYSRMSVDGFMVVDKVCKFEELPHCLSFLNNFGISIKDHDKINESTYGHHGALLHQLMNSPRHLNIIYGKYMYDYSKFGYERR